MTLSQEGRELSVQTPLGADVLVLRRMRGTEQVGRLFEFQLDLLSENSEINIRTFPNHSILCRTKEQRKMNLREID